MKIIVSWTCITHLEIKRYEGEEWSHKVGVGQLKWNLTIYDDNNEDMENIWQCAHFLRYIECNDVWKIYELSNDLNAVQKIWRLSLTSCWPKDEMWWDCSSQNVQCHSQTVVRKTADETAFHKMCNVTHCLLVMEKNGMRLPFTKCAMLPTSCWSWEKMWWVTFRKCEFHSLPVSHRKRCDETAFHKIWNVTNFLLVIGKDVMKLPFTECAMPLTSCQTYEKMWWDCLSQNVQCHSLTVGHRKRYDELPFTKCAISLTSCWS